MCVNRRSKEEADPAAALRVGQWVVDDVADEIRNGSDAVRVRPKVMAVLVALAERPGAVWLKSELLDRVWPDVVVSEASLSVVMGELRQALGDDPARPTFVETIPRRGYRLIAPVRREPVRSSQPSIFALIGGDLHIPLAVGRTVIGRDPECDARIDSHHVSRFHAAVEVEGGQVRIEDLGSKNGTWIGERLVDAPVELHTGDRVRLGRRAVTVRLVVRSQSTLTEASGSCGDFSGGDGTSE